MPLVGWLAVGVVALVLSFALIGVLVYVIVRQLRDRQRQPTVASSASLTTDVDNEKASVSDASDAESCSPVQGL